MRDLTNVELVYRTPIVDTPIAAYAQRARPVASPSRPAQWTKGKARMTRVVIPMVKEKQRKETDQARGRRSRPVAS